MLAKSTYWMRAFRSSFFRSINAVESESNALPLTEFRRSASNSLMAYFFFRISLIILRSSLFFGTLPAPYIKMSAFLSMQKAYKSFELILMTLLVVLSRFNDCRYLNILWLFELGSSAISFSSLLKLIFW